MNQVVYLVGQISPKYPETYEWRRKVMTSFQMDRIKDVEFINPCANSFNEKTLKKGEYAVTKEKRSFGLDLLVPKDREFVRRSTIGLVNMNQFDSEKPLMGSFFELAWYYDAPEKAVIGFADDLNSYECQHPFVQQAVTTWCRDWQEACYLIKKFFVQ